MAASTISIAVEGDKQIKRALKALGETEAPFLKGALDKGGRMLGQAAEGRVHHSIAASMQYAGVKGVGGALRAVGTFKHPGARSMEFGRTYYYRGFTGRRQKATGHKVKVSGGQKARPFVGIKRGDAAIGQVREPVQRLIREAIDAEWTRIGST